MPLDPLVDHPFLSGLNQAIVDKLEEIRLELLLHRALMEAGTLPPPAVLIQEFMNRVDLDAGKVTAGSIYGIHFGIDPADPNIPPILEPIHQHPRWLAAPPTTLITWATYLASPPTP